MSERPVEEPTVPQFIPTPTAVELYVAEVLELSLTSRLLITCEFLERRQQGTPAAGRAALEWLIEQNAADVIEVGVTPILEDQAASIERVREKAIRGLYSQRWGPRSHAKKMIGINNLHNIAIRAIQVVLPMTAEHPDAVVLAAPWEVAYLRAIGIKAQSLSSTYSARTSIGRKFDRLAAVHRGAWNVLLLGGPAAVLLIAVPLGEVAVPAAAALLGQTVPLWVPALIIVVGGIAAYWLRRNHALAYGIAELLAGSVLGYKFLSAALEAGADLAWVVVPTALVWLYVVVRALTNIERGIAGTALERPWSRAFGRRGQSPELRSQDEGQAKSTVKRQAEVQAGPEADVDGIGH